MSKNKTKGNRSPINDETPSGVGNFDDVSFRASPLDVLCSYTKEVRYEEREK